MYMTRFFGIVKRKTHEVKTSLGINCALLALEAREEMSERHLDSA
jgi:hypothetical protein